MTLGAGTTLTTTDSAVTFVSTLDNAQALSRVLIAGGHKVIALSRSPGTVRFATGVQSVQWDAVSAHHRERNQEY